jgi:hypothetical protein
MNPRRSPARICVRHVANECADVRGHGRSAQRRPLFQRHHSRKPRRCQVMTVSGLTITSAVRQPVQRRESRLQRHRSVFASRTWCGRVRCSTCSWCRNAKISSWSAARERAHVRRVRRSATSTEIIARAYPSPATTSTTATRTAFSVGRRGTCQCLRFSAAVQFSTNSSLPSPRHSGRSPPPFDTNHELPDADLVTGSNDRT